MKAGKPFIFRFKTPSIAEKPIIEFNDIIRGKISTKTNLIGDFSIAKNFNTPLYNFAVVIDDYDMKINYVIRGEDHISNTPKQILLYEALKFPIPQFGHLPLILAPDRSKMSKRFGATSIDEYKKLGYLPEALINFMALLGWHSKTDKEFFTIDKLIKEFSIEQIQKAGAVFNVEKLDWLNGNYIRQKSADELFNFLNNGFIDKKYKKFGDDYIKQVITLEKDRMKKFSDFSKLTEYFFTDNFKYPKVLLKWKEQDLKEIKTILNDLLESISQIKNADFNKENLKIILMEKSGQIGERGKVFWPFRAAMTGKSFSPDPIDVAMVLGKEKTIIRLKKAIKLI